MAQEGMIPTTEFCNPENLGADSGAKSFMPAQQASECIEVLNMIGKPILDVRLSRMAKPDEILCDAMRRRCNPRNNVAPYEC